MIFIDLLFQPGLHLLFNARQFGFPHQDAAQGFQPLFHVDFFQNGLAILHPGQHVGGDNIRQLIWLLHIGHRPQRFPRNAHGGPGVFIKQLVGGAHQGLHRRGVGQGLARLLHICDPAGLLLGDGLEHRPLLALHQHADGIPRQVEHLLHQRHRTHPAHIL